MRSICLGRNSKAILLLKSEIQSADETSVGSLIAEDPLVVKIEKLSVENSSGGFDCGYVLNKIVPPISKAIIYPRVTSRDRGEIKGKIFGKSYSINRTVKVIAKYSVV